MAEFNPDIKNFINSYVKALRENNAAVFIGSGVSVSQGFPSWKELLEPLAKGMGLDINKGYDFSVLAQYYVDINGGNRGEINQMLLQNFKKEGQQPSPTHQLLARLPIFTYWTTNYDTLMEQALEEAKKVPDVKKCVENLPIVRTRRDAVVYKMHGDVDFPHDAVLTKHDYEDYALKREPFRDQFKSDFLAKTFLFVGFGFRDPNLDFLVGQIRTFMHKHLHRNYYFIKRVSDIASIEYREMNLQIEQLKQYGLYPVPIDSYDEIPEILKEIEHRYRKSYIFISGSAEAYNDWLSSDAHEFISTLAYRLSEKQYKIVSGFGMNVGQSVVNGALQYMQANHIQPLWHNHLLLLPMPVDGDCRPTEGRDKLIVESGICIVLFGNRYDKVHENIIVDENIRDEFRLARNKGLDVIPVGATGYIARELWRDVYEKFETYYPSGSPELKGLIGKLDISPIKDFEAEEDNRLRRLHRKFDSNQLLDTILKIVDLLNSDI